MRSNRSDRAVRAHRFFVEGVHAPGDVVPFSGDDAHKLVNVLRLRDGDAIEVTDSSARSFRARLTVVGEVVCARLEEELPAEEAPRLEITVAQALPKGAKMDFVVEKLTELGVVAIIPFVSERSVRTAAEGKRERWMRIARAAALQCGRRDIPRIEAPSSFERVRAVMKEADVALIPWELADPRPLRDALPPLLEGARTVVIAIGPEGGFSHAEVEAARAAGAHPLWLGPRILRTETAGLVAAVIVQALAPAG